MMMLLFIWTIPSVSLSLPLIDFTPFMFFDQCCFSTSYTQQVSRVWVLSLKEDVYSGLLVDDISAHVITKSLSAILCRMSLV